MAELFVIKVAAGTFEVSEAVGKAFEETRAKLMGAGLAEEQAHEMAYAALSALIAAGAVKKTEAPKEHVPDLVELARPVLERAMQKNARLIEAIKAFTTSASDMRSALEDAGLDPQAEPSGDGSRFVWTADNGFRYQVVVPDNHDLKELAGSYTSAMRDAQATVFSIVQAVAKKAEVDTSKLAIRVSVGEDGQLNIAQRRAGGGGGGGRRAGGSNATYAYETNEAGVIVKISLNGAVLAETDPAAPKAAELEAGLKKNLPTVGKKYYLTQWNRKTGWPQS